METDIRLDVFWKDEVFAAIIRTRTPDACAMTAIHSTRFPRHIGGARLVASGGEDEVLDLALAMTEKCLAAGIRAGGQKSLVVCAPHILTSESAKAYVLEDHFREVKRHFPGVIFGPDMANPESVMDRVSLQPDLLDHVTGLSEARGGYGIDQSGFTAVGVVEATRLAAKWLQLATSRVAIQGVGAVGAHRRVAGLGHWTLHLEGGAARETAEIVTSHPRSVRPGPSQALSLPGASMVA